MAFLSRLPPWLGHRCGWVLLSLSRYTLGSGEWCALQLCLPWSMVGVSCGASLGLLLTVLLRRRLRLAPGGANIRYPSYYGVWRPLWRPPVPRLWIRQRLWLLRTSGCGSSPLPPWVSRRSPGLPMWALPTLFCAAGASPYAAMQWHRWKLVLSPLLQRQYLQRPWWQ